MAGDGLYRGLVGSGVEGCYAGNITAACTHRSERIFGKRDHFRSRRPPFAAETENEPSRSWPG